MSWQRTVASTTGRAVVRRFGSSVAATPRQVAGRSYIDPHWRRLEDGHAARLGPRETIVVTRAVGRWRKVDARVPQDGYRAISTLLGLGLWAGVVGVTWWVGSSRGRGPLASVAELDRFGEALRLPGHELAEDDLSS